MQLTQLLQSTFGFSAFRANQEAVCRAATDGRDVLLVMPTGAGKSLCYQLPGVARGGTALVVSPLIALMDDQANKLQAAGLRVARIHSGMSREDSRQACRDYLDGTLQFLFIAPERMRVPGFPEMLARRKPALIAIDEAHCISAWGHDFRPDYRTLGEFLPALRPAPVIALTATATPTVQKDIAAQLQLERPALFIHGFRRENLAIEVVELSKPRRAQFIADFLGNPERRPAIVYAPSRKIAEELAAELGRQFPAAAYHAGLDTSVRERVQRNFQIGKVQVVVATIAFGMGIDKADVRTVIHAALPASVEAYYQEIGRAGRDGLPSRTVLLHSYADRKMHDFFMERDYPITSDLTRIAKLLTHEFQMPDLLQQRLKMDAETFGKAVEKLAAQGAAVTDLAGNVRRAGNSAWQSGYERQVEFRRSQIDRMVEFAETQQCRMTALIRHFGDLADAHKPCGHCDFCAPSETAAQSFAEPTATEEKNLRAVLRALDGGSRSTGKLFSELALTKDRKQFDGLLDGLARAGLITLASDSFTGSEGNLVSYKKAVLTHEGKTLAPGEPLGVVIQGVAGGAAGAVSGERKRERKTRRVAREQERQELAPEQKKLEAALRAWRKDEAAKTGKPAFIVFSDKTLDALSAAAPRTLSELAQVSGFGPDKCERYGAEVCAICRGESVKATDDESLVQNQDELTPEQKTRESKLRAWRKEEAAKIGKPAFHVLWDRTLVAVAIAGPRTLAELAQVSGIKPKDRERYGFAICAICRGEEASGGHNVEAGQSSSSPFRNQTALRRGRQTSSAVRSEEVRLEDNQVDAPKEQLFTPRERPQPISPVTELTSEQLATEQRLRDWRKAESTRMGQPQFFVLGTSTLRNIVMAEPRTLTQLREIEGIDPDKLERFGPAILETLRN